MSQSHGADVYQANGKAGRLLDFSNTVVELEPPRGWQKRLQSLLPSLRRYPQPYATGLARHIERKLGLASGSVLVGNGSSECLEWVAQSLRGKKVVLESPCFGEYEIWLFRHGASVHEVGADEPFSPEWPRVRASLKGAQALFTAHPSNPSGLCYDRKEFREELDWCRDQGVLFVLDEALRAQGLGPGDNRFLKACAEKPGALAIRSLSKGLGLPGLRLGFVAGHPAEIAKLGRLINPWSVSSLAQAAGAWALDREEKLSASRRKELARRKEDLLRRLDRLKGKVLPVRSQTGFFLVRLIGRDSDSLKLVDQLAKKGLLVRSCASYGGWGRGYVRLNPRSSAENKRLVQALAGAL